MPLSVKVGGVWKTVSAPSVKVAGTWRTVQGGWVKVAGTWRQFYTAVLAYTPAIIVANNTLAGIGGTRSVSFSLLNSGAGSTTGATTSTPGSFTWILAGTASEYEVYVTGTASAGGAPTGASLDAWTSLGTSRTWTFSQTDNDSTWTGTYQIRRISDGAGASTGTVSMRVNSAP